MSNTTLDVSDTETTSLEDYKSKGFYEKHKTIQFDTLTEQAEYEIIAVFKTVAYSSQGYRYYDFVNADTEDDFDAHTFRLTSNAVLNRQAEPSPLRVFHGTDTVWHGDCGKSISVQSGCV